MTSRWGGEHLELFSIGVTDRGRVFEVTRFCASIVFHKKCRITKLAGGYRGRSDCNRKLNPALGFSSNAEGLRLNMNRERRSESLYTADSPDAIEVNVG